MITMTLLDGTRYTLDDDGKVLDRSDGPKGWDYEGEWTIVGFKKRHHSARTITLDKALAGADVGQGWVVDLDHGTFRLWGSPTGHRLKSVRQT